MEKRFRRAGLRSAAFGVEVILNDSGRSDRSERIAERCGLVVGVGDTVAMRLGSLDDKLQVGHIRRNGIQREGHCGTG